MPASEPLTIDAGGVDLRAEMHLPAEQTGVVVIPEVSATMENVMLDAVASRLRDADLGVLRIALLTEDEAADGNIEGLRPAPDVMGGRLGAVLDWMALDDRMAVLPFGLLGTDAGAAAALVAAADRAERIGAIVSALGQPALAGDALDRRCQPAGQLAHALTAAAPYILARHHGSDLVRVTQHDFFPRHPGPDADIRLAQAGISHRSQPDLVAHDASGIPGALEVAAVDRPEGVGSQAAGNHARLLTAALRQVGVHCLSLPAAAEVPFRLAVAQEKKSCCVIVVRHRLLR